MPVGLAWLEETKEKPIEIDPTPHKLSLAHSLKAELLLLLRVAAVLLCFVASLFM